MPSTKVSNLLELDLVPLDKIVQLLPAKDLQRLSMTNKMLKNHLDDDRFWQKFLTKNWWFTRYLPTFQADYKYMMSNAPTKEIERKEMNQEVIRYSTYSNNGSMMAAFGNECHLWIFNGETEIFHVCLSKKRHWDKIFTVAFSPDDEHLLVTGSVDHFFTGTNSRETIIYRIRTDRVSFKSFVNLDHQMLSTWYDNENIIFMRNGGNREKMRLFICSIDNQADILLYPILTFNTRVTKIYVAQHVSPRTRKIVQIANEAAASRITLHERLIEIGLAAGVDVTDMSALRGILDQDSECMPCYRLHAHRDAVSVSKCNCICHNNTDKLLVFHGTDDKVHIKVITKETLEIAKNAFRDSGDSDNPQPHDNRLFSLLQLVTDFDTDDCCFNVELSLLNSSACFSPNHKYLYITGTRQNTTSSLFSQIKPTCIDLETMTVQKIPDFEAKNYNVYDHDVCITANRDFLVLFTDNKVLIYSTAQQGRPIKTIDGFDRSISSVSIHPYLNRLIVTTDYSMHIFQSPQMCAEETEQ